MMGLTGITARTSNVAAKGFSPRLESLDGRVMPSTLHVAAGFDATPAAVRSVDTPTPPIWVGIGSGAAGGMVGSGHSSGGVDNNGGLAGGVVANGHSLGGGDMYGVTGGVIGDRAGMASPQGNVEESITRSTGEEIPQ